jgi:NTP pyrophosphatase (non-canonical NTP hydrolase)
MSKPTDVLGMGMPQSPLFGLGKEQTDAMANMQREILSAYEEASRSWLARVKSEVELWSELAEKLGKTQSLPEALGAYQQCVAQRVQMAAEDGRRLFEEYQTLMQKMTRPFSENGPRGST